MKIPPYFCNLNQGTMFIKTKTISGDKYRLTVDSIRNYYPVSCEGYKYTRVDFKYDGGRVDITLSCDELDEILEKAGLIIN
jgi:hypothetical protein